MIEQFKEFPYFPQFTFSSIAASTQNQVELLIPHNIAVYGISIQSTKLAEDEFNEFRLQFQNYETGDTLFDEPIFGMNIMTDCRSDIPRPNMVTGWHGGGFRLPSLWHLKKNQKIVCTLNTFAATFTQNYYVCLLAYTRDVDPNPGVQPFIYSFPMKLGWQDNIDGQTSVNFDQQTVNALSKPMIHDFELHSVVLNPFGTNGPNGNYGTQVRFASQISWPGKKVFDRVIIDGCAGGGCITGQNATQLSMSSIDLFPPGNVLQYIFARREIIRKGTMVRVEIFPAPTYLSTDVIHSGFNEECCMALIGNHIG